MKSNENFRRSRLSGWQRTNQSKQLPPILPEEPTRFHRFLYSLGVEEAQVRGSLSTDLRKKVIEWARRHRDQCYVPSWLLQDAGINTRYDS